MIPPVARSGSMLQFAKLLCFRRRCCWLPSRYLLLLNTSNEGKAVLFFFFRTSMHSPKIPSIAVTCYQVVSKISLGGSSTRSCRTHAITSIAFYENKHARWSALPGIMPSHTARCTLLQLFMKVLYTCVADNPRPASLFVCSTKVGLKQPTTPSVFFHAQVSRSIFFCRKAHVCARSSCV